MKIPFCLAAVASLTSALLAGCAVHTDGADTGDDADVTAASRDPMAMPTAILKFEKENNWGMHHLEWHTVRQWDLMDQEGLDYAKRQGWTRATVQEGAAGNGLEFLAMHRVMLRHLKEQFPSSAHLFDGWETPPTDPKDKDNPLPNQGTTPLDPNVAKAIDHLMNDVGSFKTDDELGLFIETKMRPTRSNPSARSKDPTSGAHNYLHNRWANSKSAIDLGDPTVNLGNQMFWRLHGWIDARWTAFRDAKGLTEDDPMYQAALQKGEDMFAHMNMPKGTAFGGVRGIDEPPPDSLRKFWENQEDD